MADRLLERFADDVRRALRWTEADDPFPVLEALGYAIVLRLVGALEETPARERAALLAVSGRALPAARAFRGERGDDADAYGRGAAIGELGARLVAGGPPGDLDALPADALDPTARRIARMVRGELDGLSAGACAIRCMRMGDERARLLWSVERTLDAEAAHEVEAPLHVAAAEPARVRSPDDGRFLGSYEDTLLEAVFFPEERQLAIYCATPIFLQVIAPGLTPKDVKPGYWLGEVAADAGPTLELEVRVGERALRWGLGVG